MSKNTTIILNDNFPELRNYIQSQILPCYASFDKAHNLEHVTTVIAESMELATHYDVEKSMVYTVAAYHDLGLAEGREFHHLASGRILLSDTHLRQWFTEERLLIMRDAIEDHRASSEHEPRTIYGKIVAEADRVISPEITLRRTVQYGLANHPEIDKEGQYRRMVSHLQKKYSEGGYLKLWIPYSSNAQQLQELRELINDEVKLRAAFDFLYNEEN